MRLAQFQIRDGAADRAVKTLETIVANNPSYRHALRQLALLYGERSIDDPKAYELVQTARQAFPDDPDVAKTLGIFTYRRELYARSADLLGSGRQDAPGRRRTPLLPRSVPPAAQALESNAGPCWSGP